MDEKKTIFLYNTASREKEEFKPIKDDFVRFYSCGQTVYDDIHVGNAKTYVGWDILVRTLKHFGYKVKHVQNLTDVGHLTDDADAGEDKIEERAKMLKEHPMELVDHQIKKYWEDTDEINMNRPDVAPRATGHIPEMIEMVETLLKKGYAYNIDNSIYFDTSKFEDYGKMAKLNLEEQETGVRDEVKIIKEKKNPSDFALWIKAPKEHIMQYTSPWGKGYPGWHLECSVMSLKYLDTPETDVSLDIHAGGIDHIPVHHTNEIAQSEAANDKKFVNYWLHSEFITVNGDKMSKSEGNFITLRELINKVGPASARFVLSQSHYRTQSVFSIEKAKSAQKRYDRLIRQYHFTQQYLKNKNVEEREIDKESEFMEKFNDALADDLNTPLAITAINNLIDELEEKREMDDNDRVYQLVNEFETMLDVLGIPYISLTDQEIEHVNKLVEFRLSLRKEKRWEEADAIRDFLADLYYNLNDVDDKTEWFKVDHH